MHVFVWGQIPPIFLECPNKVLICSSQFYSSLWDLFIESSGFIPKICMDKSLFLHIKHILFSAFNKKNKKTEIPMGQN